MSHRPAQQTRPANSPGSHESKPSCNSLGICQTRLNPCEGCTWAADAAARVAQHAFAPGVITAHANPRHGRWRRGLRLALVWSVGLVVLSMAAGYVVGSFMGRV
jgi:hypothetical protein